MKPIEDTVVLEAIEHLRKVYQLQPAEHYERVHQNNPTANALRHIEKKVRGARLAYAVPHSHWVRRSEPDYNNNAQYECANCHAGDLHTTSVSVPYCWKCGFRMDEPETVDIYGHQNVIMG